MKKSLAKKAFNKSKLKSVGWWKKKAWVVFSRWVRERDDWTCYTCGTKATGSGMHAGHFVPRSHSATFIHEMNVHAQCYVCNIIKKGNAGEYSFKLIEQYGQKKFGELVKLGRTTKQFTVQELQDLIKEYS